MRPSLSSLYSKFCVSEGSSTKILTLTCIQIKDLFFPLLGVDGRVRTYLVQSLEKHLESTSEGHLHYKNIAFQLALCYSLGFGTARKIEIARRWIQKSGRPIESLEKEIEKIRCYELPRILKSEDLAQFNEMRLLSASQGIPPFDSSESFDSRRRALVREIHDLGSVLGKEHLATNQLQNILCSLYQSYGLLEEAEIILIYAIEALMDDSEPTQRSNAKAYQEYGGWEDWEEAEYGWGEKIDAVIKEHRSKPPQRSNAKVTQNTPVIQVSQPTHRSPILEKVELLDDKTTLLMQSKLFHLISIYCDQHRWPDAEWLSIHLMERLMRVLGEQHVVTIQCIGWIGHIYLKQGRSKEAESVLLYSLEINRTLLGDTHDETLWIVQNLYDLYLQTKDRSKKFENYSMILTANSLKRSVYYKPEYHSRLEDIASLEKTFLEIGQDEFFLLNPDMAVISGIGYIVREHYHQRRFKEAEILELQLIEICKKVLPHDHPQPLPPNTVSENGQVVTFEPY